MKMNLGFFFGVLKNPMTTQFSLKQPNLPRKSLSKPSDDQIFEVEESVDMEFATVKSFLED